MPEYRVNVGDFSPEPIPGLQLTIEAEQPAHRGNGVSFHRPVTPKSFNGTTATFDLVPTVQTLPRVKYWLVGRYANGMEVNRIEVVAPVGADVLQAPDDAAAELRTIVIGYDIKQATRGVLSIDIKGDEDGMAELVVERGAIE